MKSKHKKTVGRNRQELARLTKNPPAIRTEILRGFPEVETATVERTLYEAIPFWDDWLPEFQPLREKKNDAPSGGSLYFSVLKNGRFFVSTTTEETAASIVKNANTISAADGRGEPWEYVQTGSV